MPPTLDIGLVLAGAVSAGAYSGGCLDFLLQALDAWYAAKGQPDVPPHDVRIKVATGASAGGMTAAMLASSLCEHIPPVTAAATTAEQAANKFYDAWVNRVSIEGLLEGDDLAADLSRPVWSLLDCTVLDEIAQRIITPNPTTAKAPPRPYVEDPMVVAVTLTNLRGVPYQVDFVGLTGTKMPYSMRMHGDFLAFAVGTPPASGAMAAVMPPNKAVPLDPTKLGQGSWPLFATAALATGAFPFGLAPRLLAQAASAYDDRQWYHPYLKPGSNPPQFGYYAPLSPAMGVKPIYEYEFLCVDGGTIDNEPLGLARQYLGWATATESPQHSALLLIDPFPNDEKFETEYAFPKEFSLLKLVPTLIGALVGQARFKPEELTRAIDPTVFNQYMLAPVRRRPGVRTPEQFPIACGGLGGFAGFLSAAFRAHDFRLGRVNAQAFLRRHFVLPEDDPLFAGWTTAARDRYRVRRDKLNRVVETAGGQNLVIDENGNAVPAVDPLEGFLPIIPLVNGVDAEEQPLPWPTYSAKQLDDLMQRAEARSKLVVERLIQHVTGPTATQFLLRRLWWLKRGELLQSYVRTPVEKDLRARGLLA